MTRQETLNAVLREIVDSKNIVANPEWLVDRDEFRILLTSHIYSRSTMTLNGLELGTKGTTYIVNALTKMMHEASTGLLIPWGDAGVDINRLIDRTKQ